MLLRKHRSLRATTSDFAIDRYYRLEKLLDKQVETLDIHSVDVEILKIFLKCVREPRKPRGLNYKTTLFFDFNDVDLEYVLESR